MCFNVLNVISLADNSV